jgi:hypothetical protein
MGLATDKEPHMPSSVPLVDLNPWFEGTPDGRSAAAARIDDALRDSGFLLITGHGVPDKLRADTRELSRKFFALPEAAKAKYTVSVGGRGWLPPGVEANGYAERTETPPDLKESYSVGADAAVGDPEIDAFWFQPNVWPVEIPELAAVAREYMDHMRRLSDELLTIFAATLGVPLDHFTRHTGHPTYTFNINCQQETSDQAAKLKTGCLSCGFLRVACHRLASLIRRECTGFVPEQGPPGGHPVAWMGSFAATCGHRDERLTNKIAGRRFQTPLAPSEPDRSALSTSRISPNIPSGTPMQARKSVIFRSEQERGRIVETFSAIIGWRMRPSAFFAVASSVP